MAGRKTAAAIGLVLAVAGVTSSLAGASRAEEAAAPRDIPVEDLQRGRQRDEWEVARSRHPHGR